MTRPDSDEKPAQRRHGSMFGRLRNSFITGIVVIAPIGLTVWLIWSVVGWVDGFVMPFVPAGYHPEAIINRIFATTPENHIDVNIRGVGVIVFLIFTVLVGWIAKGLIGRSFIGWGEDLVGRLPIVRSIYNGLKQIAETVFTQGDAKFDKVCLVEYPRKGVWAMAFISSTAKGEVASRISAEGDEVLAIFMPSTPNPTTGFLMFLPRSEIIELDMTLEQAAKLVISAGLVYPGDQFGPSGEGPRLPPGGL